MGTPLNVLIVEDSEDDALLLARQLKAGGFDAALERVETAETMRAALAARRLDVILCDFALPRFDVSGALKLVEDAGLDLPLIVVSGAIGEERLVELMKDGVHDVVLKDKLARLAPAIKRELAEAEGRRARKRAEEALRESEASLANAQRIACIGNWEWNVETDEVRRSAEICRLLGMTAKDLDTSREAFLKRVHPDDREAVDSAFEALLNKPEPFILQFRIVLPDGGVRILHEQGEVTLDDAGKPVLVVGTTQDITERKLAEQRLDYLAHHDELTDLSNRVLFRDRLEQGVAQAKRRGELVGLHLLDLDHFKDVNDTLGHHVGDELLKGVARRLEELMRATDTVARLGGDEFAVVQTEIKDIRDITVVADKLLGALAEPFEVEGNQIHIGGTIGIVVFPNDGAEAQELLQKADLALYAGKARGRNIYQFFNEKMRTTLNARKELEIDLRRALERERDIRLHYQPLVTLETGRIVGVEALLRWRHPERGMVPPAEFIPVAESTGLIRSLGSWVLRSACEQAAQWHGAGLPLLMAINVSAVQILSGDFASLIEEALASTGLEARHLEIEITETMFLRTRDPVVGETLRRLYDMGVSISVDDFGTGYGSLTYLRRFPVSKLKIDRSFVQGIGKDADDEAIVRAVIGLGRSLNMRTLAEGIETEEQLAFLKADGCDEGQGYYFSPAVPPEELVSLLEEQTPPAPGRARRLVGGAAAAAAKSGIRPTAG